MSIKALQAKLDLYHCKTVIEEEHAVKEITQEIALMALSRAHFFSATAFHGGTALRILYGLPRFSEDLGFLLLRPDSNFLWNRYLSAMMHEFLAFGFDMEVTDKNKADNAVKKIFLKSDSIGSLLTLAHHKLPSFQKKIKIKLEIDTNPPDGSLFEMKYLDFPFPFAIKTQTLESSFALKCHALLCREYVKGRDWFDFVWYVARSVFVNLPLLQNALFQIGPWAKQFLSIDKEWILKQLHAKILSIDWEATKQDVIRFLKPEVAKSLEVWSQDFFLHELGRLRD